MSALEEICPELPERFTGMIAALNTQGAVFSAFGEQVQPALDGLRDELLDTIRVCHVGRGKAALDFARATVIEELAIRTMVHATASQLVVSRSDLVVSTETPKHARLLVVAKTTGGTADQLESYDELARDSIGRFVAIQLLSRRFFGGASFLLAAEQQQVEALGLAVEDALDIVVTSVWGAECAAFIRDGALNHGQCLAETIEQFSIRNARKTLLEVAAASEQRSAASN